MSADQTTMTLAEVQKELKELARPRDPKTGKLSAFRDTAAAMYFIGRAQYSLNRVFMILDPKVVESALHDAILRLGDAKDLLNLPDEPDLSDDGIEVEFTDEVDNEELRGVELRSHHVE